MQKMNITMSREEVRLMLDANNDRMRYLIKHNKLEPELRSYGYAIINQYKKGRHTFYDLSRIAIDKWEAYQSTKNIKKKDEHTEYVEKRLISDGLSSPRSKFIRENNIDISETSAMRYDKMMLEDGVINIKNTNTIKQVDTGAKNCVYRMIDKNGEVIYIGKSVGLKSRMRLHATEDKVNDWFNMEVDKIEFHRFDQYGDCSMAEIYLITKTKPKYNKEFMSWDISITIEDFENLTWEPAGFVEVEECEYEKGKNYDKFIEMLRCRQ